ncbi:MAG TPA: DcaP family trimeric outer membrane transporter [Stellaceae bacterium]|nr:DcaP family trimeric outer membrane transporter [Stellaceae bacterium]
MTKKRDFRKAAAVGSLTAAIALLTGLSVARADELADLRANQQLLEQRINQLAQAQAQGAAPGGVTGANAYGTTPVPGAEMVGGSFPRSFLIPGTDTSIRVGGFADETIDYYLQGGPPNGTQSTTVGVTGNLNGVPLSVGHTRVPGYPTAGNLVPTQIGTSRGNGVFSESPRESRLNVETRTPTAYGEARTFIEFDFAGTNAFSGSGNSGQTSVSDSLVPRLRYAYGTLGGFLAGQANSNFEDADANPETLDFGGPAGEAGLVRVPQVRYTLAGPYGTAFSVSAETPETDVFTPAGKITSDSNNQVLNTTAGLVPTSNGGTNCVANGILVINAAGCTLAANPTKASAPDVTFASYMSQPWGHVDAKFVVRPTLDIVDGRYVDQKFVGYGGGLSGDVKPGWWGYNKDDFQWQFTVGNGIGRYINDGTNAGLATNYLVAPTSAAAAALISTQTVQEFGATVGYQHFWVPNLRSTVAYGIEEDNINSQLIGPVESTVANKQLMTVHANLIWSPVAFIDTGVEYMWGHRKVVANIYGEEQAIIGKVRVKF